MTGMSPGPNKRKSWGLELSKVEKERESFGFGGGDDGSARQDRRSRGSRLSLPFHLQLLLLNFDPLSSPLILPSLALYQLPRLSSASVWICSTVLYYPKAGHLLRALDLLCDIRSATWLFVLYF